MKKFLVLLIVLAFVAPAMADDTLDVSGQMRVEAYTINNSAFSDADDDDLAYWDQRLRLQMKIKPNDAAMAVLRTDITEGTWGAWQNRPDAGTNGLLMIDRAYLSIDSGMVNITGGLNAYNLGNAIVYNNQGQGIQFTIKTPATIRLGITKENENGYNADSEETEVRDDDGNITDYADAQDTDTQFLDVGFKSGGMSVNVFYAALVDGRAGNQETRDVMGVQYKNSFGAVSLNVELDMLGGEDADGNTLTGTQLYAKVTMKASDQLTIGSHLAYAAGTDAADETQITYVNNFGDFGVAYDVLWHQWPGAFDPFASWDNDMFMTGANQGAISIAPFATFKVKDDLSVGAQLIYMMAGGDSSDTTKDIDSQMLLGLGGRYNLAPSANLDFGYTMASKTAGSDNDTEYEGYSGYGVIMSVGF